MSNVQWPTSNVQRPTSNFHLPTFDVQRPTSHVARVERTTCYNVQHKNVQRLTSNVQRTHCTLHAAHCTLHTAYCTLHTAHCPLHTASCTLRTAHCTLHTAHCTLHTAHCTLHTASGERRKANGVHTAKTANTAKPARTGDNGKRLANGQRPTALRQVGRQVSLCRSLSVFMIIVAICQVTIQQHTHTISHRKRTNANVWDPRYGETRTRLTLTASVSLCQFQQVSICAKNITARTFSTVEHVSASHLAT